MKIALLIIVVVATSVGCLTFWVSSIDVVHDKREGRVSLRVAQVCALIVILAGVGLAVGA